MPGLVSLREVAEAPPVVAEAPPVASLEDLPSPAEVVTAVVNLDHTALIKIVTDLVAQKPTSAAEALKLVAKLQEKIAEWALSELPEKDSILAGIKMVQTVAGGIGGSGCMPCLRK
jgi:hypothetical protein